MLTFALLMLCSACLVQNVYSQIIEGPGITGSYGGEAISDVKIDGEIRVSGTTRVEAQVPVIGAVRVGVTLNNPAQ